MHSTSNTNTKNDDLVVEIESQKSLTSRRRHFFQGLSLSFGSLGAVYGDIGTSPLYVINSIKVPEDPVTPETIYGCCSLIFWLFVIIVFAKYTLLVLQLGPNAGEGGQIAIYAKIARSLHFGPKGIRIPGAADVSDLELLRRMDTMTSADVDVEYSWRRNPKVVEVVSILTLLLAFLGCSLVISDGLLTPTTTALTAVGGIQVAVTSFTAIVGVSEAVLIVLFAMQYLGSTKLSLMFAPIMVVWLLSLAISGIYNIAVHDPTVFRSLSPHYAVRLLQKVGIDAFGGAMLAITGTEAMFADVGHFGKLPIQIGITFTLVCLTFTYLGQGAYLVKNPRAFSNVFYASLPGGIGNGFYWYMFVLAILSTIVASQALILGVMSIVSQLINLDCFPKLYVKRFSVAHKGKVFIPTANLLLLVGVVGCTAAFNNSNNVTAAYGLGISLDFIVTSSILTIAMIFVYEFNFIWILLFVCVFMSLEMCLVIANVKKVSHGAWFPLMMCAIFMTFLLGWRYCRDRTVTEQIKARVRINKLFPQYLNSDTFDVRPTLVSVQDGSSDVMPLSVEPVPRTVIIYSNSQSQDLTSSPNTLPRVYAMLVRNFLSMPDVVVFCSLKTCGLPTVNDEDKVVVYPTKVPGHYRAVVRFGFTEQVTVNEQLIELMQLQLDEPETPIVHIFEKHRVECLTYARTRNPFVTFGHFLRKVLINQLFGPINAAFQDDDRVESCDKMFVGGILKV